MSKDQLSVSECDGLTPKYEGTDGVECPDCGEFIEVWTMDERGYCSEWEQAMDEATGKPCWYCRDPFKTY
jgi:hypothetical protein